MLQLLLCGGLVSVRCGEVRVRWSCSVKVHCCWNGPGVPHIRGRVEGKARCHQNGPGVPHISDYVVCGSNEREDSLWPAGSTDGGAGRGTGGGGTLV